uniref:all-trans-nonaprenyl-diphosphate synthase [geranylgeranyl-diphosphatespecific] n=1 Tax=Noccaea caerulescens TaxID=107243 RepID=A0A1J3IMH1_NOCCA
MMMSCRNIDLGTSVLDLMPYGCSCTSSPTTRRVLFGNCSKTVCRIGSRSYGGNLVFLRRDSASCRAIPAKPKETTLVTGLGQDKTVMINLRQEARKPPISLENLFGVVADDLQRLNDNLLAIVGAENPVLISAAEQIFGAGGKRMRPGLVFLVSRATAELAGLKELTVEHRRLAEIIEMIHTASLIHDDVLDESDMRRGKETVHELFGTRVAVLAGDFMFAQASWYLANLENLEVIKLISQVIKDFASGEIKQASSLFDCDVKLEDYLLKSYYKTASLVAASTKGAAIFSKVESGVAEQMYQFGKNLGLSFQVVDDILDFTQSSEQLGKPAANDLAKGNITAPVIFALENEPRLREIIESEFCEPGSLEEAIEMVRNRGGIKGAQELAKEKAEYALKNLNCLPRSGFRSALEDMVMFNLERID